MPSQIFHRQSTITQFNNFAVNAESPSAISGFLSMSQKASLHSAIRQIIVLSKQDIVEAIYNKSQKIFSDFEFINPNADVFQVGFSIKQEAKQSKGVFVILPSENDNLHRITTISESDFWHHTVQKLVRKSYPDLMPVFFKQNEIRDALLGFEKSLGNNFQIRIVDTTLKSHLNNKLSKTERYWAELPISEIFDIATERGLWFTSLKFSVRKRIGESNRFRQILSGRLNKYGEVHFDWFYSEITDNLVSILENFVVERLSLLQKRGIRENNYKATYPLEISYNNEVFADIKEVRRFGEVITKYKDASKAVFHGNPYYHASIADFLDGSSFEIWILSPQRVIIAPQAKASSQALERLISFIFYEFKEGKLDEYTGS